MSPKFGVHAGLQNTTVDELRSIWQRSEEAGFDWVSVWDHFYAADGQGYECHEAIAMHAALACSTSRVRCGCLVYCAGYRHPGVLAKAIATIDHLSGGRADIGLGAGWAQLEYAAFGIPFPGAGPPTRPARGGRRGDPQPAARRDHRLQRRALPVHRRPARAPAGPGRAADLDRRHRRAPHAAHRGPLRRRLERAVHLAGGVRPQARRPGRALRRRGPRPVRDPLLRSTSASAPTRRR
jgi:hypothetical protein